MIIVTVFSACAVAQESLPGDACTAANAIRYAGGPETSGKAYMMTCQSGVWLRVTESDASGNFGVRQAAPQAPLHVGGEAIIGKTTGLACNAALEGGMRYDPVQSCMQFCNGVSWNCIASSSCDNIPAYFAFTDQNSLGPSSLYASDIVAITGMDPGCSATIGVSGQGTPQYRVCSDSGCASVVVNWTAANNVMAMQGQYLQLRATTAATAGTTHIVTMSIGAVSSNWRITTTPADCSTGAIGTVCADGSVYAGLSPDGNVPMFAARCDGNMVWNGTACTMLRGTYPWNSGTSNWVDTALSNCASPLACGVSGKAHTALLVSADSDSVMAGTQPHIAAKYCDELDIHGHDDWYLPSILELDVLFKNKNLIQNFNSGFYWSSNEHSPSGAWAQRFSDGYQTNYNENGTKSHSIPIRCVRQ